MDERPARTRVAPELEGFVGASDRAGEIFARLAASDDVRLDSLHYFTAALSGLYGRHALAEIALGALTGGQHGDVVAVTRQILPEPPTLMVSIEAYGSAFLFGAWSTIETAAFAVNALGYCVAPTDFHSIATSVSLKAISPSSMMNHAACTKRFPHFSSVLTANRNEIETLNDHHAASKHRHATMVGAAFPLRPEQFGTLVPLSDLTNALSEVYLPMQPRVALRERAGHVLPPGAVIPPNAIAVTAPQVRLGRIVDGWRALVTSLGVALRDDVEALRLTIPATPSGDDRVTSGTSE